MKIILNATRYNTEDLQRAVDRCWGEQKDSTKGQEIQLQFLEYVPKTQEIPIWFHSPSLPSEQVVMKVEYVQVLYQPYGIILLAAPESWCDPLECIASINQQRSILLPPPGVRLLMDRLEGLKAGAVVALRLDDLQIRVDLSLPRPDDQAWTYTKKRSQNVAASRKIREMFVGNLRKLLSQVDELQKVDQRTLRHALTLPDSFPPNYNDLVALPYAQRYSKEKMLTIRNHMKALLTLMEEE